jgi:hypothetical protein
MKQIVNKSHAQGENKQNVTIPIRNIDREKVHSECSWCTKGVPLLTSVFIYIRVCNDIFES